VPEVKETFRRAHPRMRSGQAALIGAAAIKPQRIKGAYA
jgi:hypothetical protein